ncbi:hypothetical protein PM21P2_00042 [Parabacteroides phage PM21P2]|nr:hypothetical protein PM21P1_00018 [Parabacteroides phage PM21P1]WAX17314.1 hypothetical protein PM21P2_00042 [Parabacteroides phage PM21P2]
MKLKNSINVNTVSVGATPLLPISQALLGQSSNEWSDGFPSLSGDVTRWKFGGLTNEEMSAMTTPQVADKFGKGRFLEFKNLAWAGMSGVGGYTYNFNSFILKDSVIKPTDVKGDSFRMIGTGNDGNVLVFLNYSDSADWRIRITGMKEGDRCSIGNANKSSEHIIVSKDGTYTFQKQYAATSPNGIWYKSSQEVDVLVEQLPLYPGAIVFDGVDDFGVCGNFPILTKEKGYTVVALRQYLDHGTDQIRALITNAPNSIVSRSTVTFELVGSDKSKANFSFGRGKSVKDFEPNALSYMTSTSYNGQTITPGDYTESFERLLVGGFSENGKYGCNAAIWELVFLDHDATPEELAKIESYFIINYPFLFN